MSPLLFLAIACQTAPPVAKATATAPIAAADSLAPLVEALATAYTKQHPTAVFEVQGSGDGVAWRRLLDDEVKAVVTTRPPTPAEVEQSRVDGYKLDEASRQILGVNVVAVVTYPGSPLGSVTYEQLIGVFCSGTIDDWSHFGLDAGPIRAWAPNLNESGERVVFEDFFCGPHGLSDKVRTGTLADIRGALVGDPASIAFVSLSEHTGKVLGLRPEPTAASVAPTQQNVIRGSYPLYHDLYLYLRAGAPAPLTEFAAWSIGPNGQDVVDEARFVPVHLRPARLDEPRPMRETVEFEPSSSTPDRRSAERLGVLVDELRERLGTSTHIVLEGFADSQEPDAVALGEARARTVQAILEKELPGSFFEIIPRGAEAPIAPNTTPFGRQRNRRVQVYLADEERDRVVIAPSADDGKGLP